MNKIVLNILNLTHFLLANRQDGSIINYQHNLTDLATQNIRDVQYEKKNNILFGQSLKRKPTTVS